MDPDPDTHQIKVACGSGSQDKLDPVPDPHQFADDNPKCMEYEPV